MRLAVVVAVAAMSAACVGVPAAAASPGARQLTGVVVADRVTGLDVSVWQHVGGAKIDWRAVARHNRFVYVEATGGAAGRRSPFYGNDSSGARRAGLAVGAYDLPVMQRPVPASARRDAAHFAAIIGRQDRAGTLPPAADIEINPDRLTARQIVQWISIWAAEVVRRTGRTPLIYTYPMFWRTSVAGTGAFSRRLALWTAFYIQRPTAAPLLPHGWRSWLFWQAAGDSGRAQGVATPVDLDVFNGSLEKFNHLALRGQPAPAPATPRFTFASPLDAALYSAPTSSDAEPATNAGLSSLAVTP